MTPYDSDRSFDVETTIGHKRGGKGNQTPYLQVKWSKYDEPSWELLDSLKRDIPHMVAEYIAETT